MVNIRFKLLDKGHIVQEQLLRLLQKHEDALGETSGELEQRIATVEQDILSMDARIKKLEDKESP